MGKDACEGGVGGWGLRRQFCLESILIRKPLSYAYVLFEIGFRERNGVISSRRVDRQ